MAPAATHLDADALARIDRVGLAARRVVDGYLAGLHRSDRHGFSVEFAQHREYAPGDDFKHLDWKVLGRSDRYYLKQYELETNLVAWLAVDASESMRYGSTDGATKYDTACTAAAALAHLVARQGDSAGLATFDTDVREVLSPGSSPTHLRDLLRVMAAGPGGEKTDPAGTLHRLADRFTRRGVVMIFGDCLDDTDGLLAGLRHLRYRKHEVVLFHVLDPAERDFPFQQPTLFRGLEEWPELLTDPRGVRKAYLAEFNGFLDALRAGCRDRQVDYVPLFCGDDLGLTLAEYLTRRRGR